MFQYYLSQITYLVYLNYKITGTALFFYSYVMVGLGTSYDSAKEMVKI